MESSAQAAGHPIQQRSPRHRPFLLALAGAALATVTVTVTDWLGGEPVDRLGIGVAPDAGPDTPASYETGIRLRRSSADRA
jgi:hypothetical protein